MSPNIERFIPGLTIEQEGQIRPVKCLMIRLDTPDEFDPNLFDESICELGCALKWIVRGSDMFIFPGNLSHLDASLQLGEDKGELQAAGFLDVPPISSKREIYRYSSSLSHILSRAESDRYKLAVIKQRLGSYFEVK